MRKKTAFLGDLSNYFAARVLLIALSFATFPLLTRMLSVPEYGVISLTLRLVLLLSVLSKCGLQYSATRFYESGLAEGSEFLRRRFYSTLVLGPLLTSFAVVAIYLPILLVLRNRIADPFMFRCLLLAPALIVLRSLQPILLSFLRNEGRSRLHSALEVLTRTLTLLAFLVLLFSGLRNSFHVLAATTTAEACVVLLQLSLLLRRKLVLLNAMDWTLIRTSLVFGAPLIAYELSSIVLDSGDRLLVRHFLGDTQLGLYSAAYNISGYLQDTIMTPLNLAIFPVYMRLWNEEGQEATQAFLSKSLTWFSVVACAIGGVAILCSHDAIVLLASTRFAEANRLLPILIPGLMLYATHIFLNVGLILQKRTTLMAVLVACSAATNLALNFILIPRLGLIGGAWATLLSYLLLIALLARINQKILPLSPDFSLSARALASATAAFVIAACVHTQYAALTILLRAPLDLALFLAFFILPSTSLRQMARHRLQTFFQRTRYVSVAAEPASSSVDSITASNL